MAVGMMQRQACFRLDGAIIGAMQVTRVLPEHGCPRRSQPIAAVGAGHGASRPVAAGPDGGHGAHGESWSNLADPGGLASSPVTRRDSGSEQGSASGGDREGSRPATARHGAHG